MEPFRPVTNTLSLEQSGGTDAPRKNVQCVWGVIWATYDISLISYRYTLTGSRDDFFATPCDLPAVACGLEHLYHEQVVIALYQSRPSSLDLLAGT